MWGSASQSIRRIAGQDSLSHVCRLVVTSFSLSSIRHCGLDSLSWLLRSTRTAISYCWSHSSRDLAMYWYTGMRCLILSFNCFASRKLHRKIQCHRASMSTSQLTFVVCVWHFNSNCHVPPLADSNVCVRGLCCQQLPAIYINRLRTLVLRLSPHSWPGMCSVATAPLHGAGHGSQDILELLVFSRFPPVSFYQLSAIRKRHSTRPFCRLSIDRRQPRVVSIQSLAVQETSPDVRY